VARGHAVGLTLLLGGAKLAMLPGRVSEPRPAWRLSIRARWSRAFRSVPRSGCPRNLHDLEPPDPARRTGPSSRAGRSLRSDVSGSAF